MPSPLQQPEAGAVERDPLFWPCFVLAAACALVPLWRARFLPLFDFPAHLVHIAIWQRLDDPGWGYQRYYEPSLHLVPYWGYWYPVKLLATLFPLESANKLYLSLYVLALPASLLLLGRRLGRSRYLCLFGFPLAYSFAFSFGFIGFSMACALSHLSLLQADRCLERASGRRLLGLLLLLLVTYFTHFLPWLLAVLGCVPLGLARRPPAGRALRVAAVLAGTCALAAVNLHFAARANLYGIAASAPTLSFRAEGPLDALRQVPARLWLGWPGIVDDALLAVLVAGLAALLLTARARSGTSAAARADLLPLAWCGFALAGYALVPFYLLSPVHWWNAGGRLISPAVLQALLLPRGPIVGRWRALMLPPLAVCIAYPLLLSERFVGFDARLGGLVTLMAEVPRGSSTLTLAFGDSGDPAVDDFHRPYRAAHSYPQLLAGGFDAYQYRNNFPFRLIDGRALPAPPWPWPDELTAEMAGRHDYLLTRGELHDLQILEMMERMERKERREVASRRGRPPLPTSAAPLLVGRSGAWRLYASGAAARARLQATRPAASEPPTAPAPAAAEHP